MLPKKIEKPWGYEEIWGDVPGKYLGKTLHINMRNRLSLQFHKEKEETIYIIRGVLTLITQEWQEGDGRMPSEKLVETKQKLGPGEYYHIKPGHVHRFFAENGDVVLAEVSTYYPDDVVRLEDDYGRK
jgi:mannose-6-phosphate isomerase